MYINIIRSLLLKLDTLENDNKKDNLIKDKVSFLRSKLIKKELSETEINSIIIEINSIENTLNNLTISMEDHL